MARKIKFALNYPLYNKVSAEAITKCLNTMKNLFK